MAPNREREARVKPPANRYFMEAVSRQPAYLISLFVKGYRKTGPMSAFLSITIMIVLTGYLTETDFNSRLTEGGPSDAFFDVSPATLGRATVPRFRQRGSLKRSTILGTPHSLSGIGESCLR